MRCGFSHRRAKLSYLGSKVIAPDNLVFFVQK